MSSTADVRHALAGALAKRVPGDHLSLAENASLHKLLAKFNKPGAGERVLYSSFIVKINSRSKAQERVLVITDQAVYNVLPSDYSKCKRRIEFELLESVTMSQISEEFVLHVPSQYDYRLHSLRKKEIVECLKRAYQGALRADLPVHLTTEAKLNDICVKKRMSKKQRDILQMERSKAASDMAAAGGAPGADAETTGWSTDHAEVTLEDFDLLKVVGRGSFGKVMLVRKKGDDSGRVFAMKILRKSAILEKGQVEHTKAERRILETIRHPFLMNLHYAFQTPAKLYLVMDYLTGGELFFHLKNARRFSEDRARFYTAEIVLGLEHLHAHGVIYRDLKPENILLDAEGHLRLTDFGLSKEVRDGQSTLTFCGTPEYLAPEIVANAGHGKEVDWWSMGILLFEMLVGLPPFYNENANVMYELIRKAELRIPSFVSWNARSLLTGLLVRDPKERLGAGAADAAPIKAHPFFEGIDWDRLYRREIEAPFRPTVRHAADTSNVDAEFTAEPVVDSMVPRSELRDVRFDGFTYVDASVLGK